MKQCSNCGQINQDSAVQCSNCGQYLELINPKILSCEGSQVGVEGCLSVKNKTGDVERPYKVTVNAQNRYGDNMVLTVEGLLAVVLCHEIDHLDGVLFIDKLVERK